MNLSTCWRRTIGEEHTYENIVLFFDCMHCFTLYMKAMTPKRNFIPYKLHGQLWAKTISEYGHSLDGLREILLHDGCFPKAPNISFTFSHGEMVWAASKWHASHLQHLDLRQARDALRCLLLGEYGYYPKFHIFLSHALGLNGRMHKKKAWFLWLTRREFGHPMLNLMSMYLL